MGDIDQWRADLTQDERRFVLRVRADDGSEPYYAPHEEDVWINPAELGFIESNESYCFEVTEKFKRVERQLMGVE